MSTTELNYNLAMTLVETLDADEQPSASSASERRRTISGMNKKGTLDSTTTPALEKPPGHQKVTIGAGTTTIDLTAMPAARDPSLAIDNTGKKLIGLLIAADKDNDGDVTIAPGSSNPYPLFGTGNTIKVAAGLHISAAIIGVASTYGAVGVSAKTIDISGTQDDIVEIEPLFGT